MKIKIQKKFFFRIGSKKKKILGAEKNEFEKKKKNFSMIKLPVQSYIMDETIVVWIK